MSIDGIILNIDINKYRIYEYNHMSAYKTIQGFTIQSLSSNPSPLIVGQIFYDTTTNTLKIVVDVAGTPTVKTINLT